jgi:hypothetical protein
MGQPGLSLSARQRIPATGSCSTRSEPRPAYRVEEALATFCRSELDALVLENLLIEKKTR